MHKEEERKRKEAEDAALEARLDKFRARSTHFKKLRDARAGEGGHLGSGGKRMDFEDQE